MTVAATLQILADPVRAAILERLATESLCVCHLQDELGAKQTLVSHHLRALREAGLVLAEPCGRFTYYRLAVEVDDHDLDHATYTDADKSIADIGWWEEHDRTDRRMLFTLHGRQDSIRYALIRTDQNWLLHRMKDA